MSKPNHGPRTSITDIPVCNDRLYKETGIIMDLEARQVREITDFVGEYIATTMRAGTMEAVMIPKFGKFRPKKKLIQTYARVKANERNGMDLLYRALKGKKLIDKREQKDDRFKPLGGDFVDQQNIDL